MCSFGWIMFCICFIGNTVLYITSFWINKMLICFWISCIYLLTRTVAKQHASYNSRVILFLIPHFSSLLQICETLRHERAKNKWIHRRKIWKNRSWSVWLYILSLHPWTLMQYVFASNSREAYLILVMQFHARDFVYAGESLYLVSLLNYSIQFNGPM